MPSDHPSDTDIAKRIEELLAKRSLNSSICPSEVARSLASDQAGWRALMPNVRRVATSLARKGTLVVTQKGQEVDAETVKGAIRLSLRRRQDPPD